MSTLLSKLSFEVSKLFIFISIYGLIDEQLVRMLVMGIYVGGHIGWYWAFFRANRLLRDCGTGYQVYADYLTLKSNRSTDDEKVH
jgi:hypothetical protein